MDIHIGIDVGGTFTDIAVYIASERRFVLHKLPSTPREPDRAIVEGVAAVLAAHGLDPKAVRRLSHGTTVGTNALIERRCGTVALVTTEGFRDLLEIGRQVRPLMYDVHADRPPPLVPRRLRFEIRERCLADGTVRIPLDEDGIRALGRRLASEGVDCVVVCFLHAYAFPGHEERAADLLREALPETVQVQTSFAVYPEFREYERFSTAVLNGALVTVMNRYLSRLSAGIAGLGIEVEPKISQSAGGLMSIDMARALPIRASLSGPAAGVLGAAHRAAAAGFRDVITLDIGGTSADVCLLRDARPAEVRERTLAGFPLKLPALDVNAVGAGGGSIAWIDRDGLLKVGPESAGADPGPVCYGLGGTRATVTDANVVLGRLSPGGLLDGRMPIRRDLAVKAVRELARHLGLAETETALGIIRIAAATIVKAIRAISVERGHDPGDFSLFAFGGAGALLATDVALELGIHRLIVPPHPGILCAEGLLHADLRSDFVRTLRCLLEDGAEKRINTARRELQGAAQRWTEAEGLAPCECRLEWSAALRYRGQNYELTAPLADEPLDAQRGRALAAAFHDAHEQAYGFASPREPVEIVNLGVKAIGELPRPVLPSPKAAPPGSPGGERAVCFGAGESVDTPVYRREALAPGQRVAGPAIIEQMDATTLVFPGSLCTAGPAGNLLIDLPGRVRA